MVSSALVAKSNAQLILCALFNDVRATLRQVVFPGNKNFPYQKISCMNTVDILYNAKSPSFLGMRGFFVSKSQ
jgi:hypothetical protein